MLGGSNKVTIDVLCLCGTTLRIRNVDTYILFYVLRTCTHDVTLWWDFLHFHSTLTDSEKVYVRIYISYYSEPSPPIALRMCAADTKRCASHTPMYLSTSTASQLGSTVNIYFLQMWQFYLGDSLPYPTLSFGSLQGSNLYLSSTSALLSKLHPRTLPSRPMPPSLNPLCWL